MSLQENKVIDHVGQRKSCIMREISDHLRVAVSTMTGLIDKLEEKGLVRRERTEEDRRIVRISLTEKGEKNLSIARGGTAEAVPRSFTVA